MLAGVGFIQRARRGFDVEGSAVGHRVAGVDCQVQNDLREVVGIELRVLDRLFQFRDQLDVFG